jgi:flagellin-specific chaperone FliS
MTSLSLLKEQITKYYSLYIWIVRKLVAASNSNVAEQFNEVRE